MATLIYSEDENWSLWEVRHKYDIRIAHKCIKIHNTYIDVSDSYTSTDLDRGHCFSCKVNYPEKLSNLARFMKMK